MDAMMRRWQPGEVVGQKKASESILTGLALKLGAIAALSAVAGIVLLNYGQPNDTPTECGKWLLQLASVFAGAGAISALLRQVDLTRAQREVWVGFLQEVIAAHDRAHQASRLIPAHVTAKTYSEQIIELGNVRESLRRVMTSQQLHGDPLLRQHLQDMRRYLKKIIKEYNEKYLPVSRQQRLDEAYLSQRIATLGKADSNQPPLIPDDLKGPLPAWQALADGSKFPSLVEFCNNFDESEFRRSYESAKPILEHHAGILRKQQPHDRPDKS
ncbi:hypothetical protein [Streptomyces sp. NPDC001137]|uniref:hypothetical protein n=1 Tax=Streptomyces sp. NPDC001137 TaxID=3154378 RepID=UPI003333E572